MIGDDVVHRAMLVWVLGDGGRHHAPKSRRPVWRLRHDDAIEARGEFDIEQDEIDPTLREAVERGLQRGGAQDHAGRIYFSECLSGGVSVAGALRDEEDGDRIMDHADPAARRGRRSISARRLPFGG